MNSDSVTEHVACEDVFVYSDTVKLNKCFLDPFKRDDCRIERKRMNALDHFCMQKSIATPFRPEPALIYSI